MCEASDAVSYGYDVAVKDGDVCGESEYSGEMACDADDVDASSS